jgi:hypothetical protein
MRSRNPDEISGLLKKMERAKGIEPSYEAWEASVLPLNYARVFPSQGTARNRL